MGEQRKRITRRTTSRATVLVVAFSILALVVAGRLAFLQIYSYEYYKEQVMKEITLETEVNPERGTIYDTNGNILATNRTVYLCFISPQDIIDAMKEKNEKDKDEDGDGESVFTWKSADGTAYDRSKMNQMIARFFAETLDCDYDEVIKKAAMEGRRYEVIKEKISEEDAQKVREFISENGLTTQIYLRAGAIRYYPYGDLAAHTLGFTNSDGIGTYGLEAYYNNLLEGTSGRYVTAQDALNNDMGFKYETYVAEENGYDVHTTLDTYIQYELENQLEATVRENMAANRATGVVLNVNTGAVLAMATYPSFDLNDPYTLDEWSAEKLTEYESSETRNEDAYRLAQKAVKEKKNDATEEEIEKYYKKNFADLYEKAQSNKYFELLYTMWKNKAITELYEPGSTSKIITTAMVFEEGTTNPSEMFTCTGALKIDGYSSPIHCHKAGGHGTVTYARGLQQSCNPTLMTVALRLGREPFYKYFLNFGYGDRTGIDLPNEVSTYYHSYQDFSTVSLAVYAFGQTYKTTPLQQLTAISAVANGGYLVTPHLLKEVADDSGKIIDTYGTQIKRQVVSTQVCETIAGILEEGVSTDGGAKNAYVKGYKVAAKTGTSEKIDQKNESGVSYLRVGSCVAFAPAYDPEIAVIIVCDEPMGGSVYGSVVAAPYVSRFLATVLPYIGYEPQYSASELETVEISVRNYTGFTVDDAKVDIANKGLRSEVVGSGTEITGQVPAPGSTMSKENGRIILYTGGETAKDTAEVPDVVGKSAEAANRILVDAGLNISITGATNDSTATVAVQSIAAGTKVPAGTVVEVSLRDLSITDD